MFLLFPLLSPFVKPGLSSLCHCLCSTPFAMFLLLSAYEHKNQGICTLFYKEWKQKEVNALRHSLSASAEMSCSSSSKLTLCMWAHCVMRIMISCWKCLIWIRIFSWIFTPEYSVVLSHSSFAWIWFHYLQIACLCRCVNRNAWLCGLILEIGRVLIILENYFIPFILMYAEKGRLIKRNKFEME